MMALLQFVYDTPYALFIRESLWGYPIFETLHLIGIVLLFGSIALTDLRILGVSPHLSVRKLTEQFLLRVTWAGFALTAFSGLSLFAAYATTNIENPVFLLKMGLIVAAGGNAAFFQFRVFNSVAKWDSHCPVPAMGRASALLSITLWVSTIAAGRLIAYPEILGG